MKTSASPEKPVSESNGEFDCQPVQRLSTLMKFQNDFNFDSMKVPPSGLFFSVFRSEAFSQKAAISLYHYHKP